MVWNVSATSESGKARFYNDRAIPFTLRYFPVGLGLFSIGTNHCVRLLRRCFLFVDRVLAVTFVVTLGEVFRAEVRIFVRTTVPV